MKIPSLRQIIFTSIFLFTLFFLVQAKAQQSAVSVTVSDGKGILPFAMVRASSLSDSARTWALNADSAGKAVFNLDYGLYKFQASFVGFKPSSKSLNVKVPNLAVSIIISPEANQLQAVTVTASRPLMRQDDDKTIVDAEMLAATSSSAFEIIEKTPGLFVDQEGNIYLTSSTPASIFINGREQKISPTEIAAMLRSLPPNSIASIEIMRTPSARYEASSSGGIVNVVLKKGFKIGLTGSLNTGMSQGKYGNRTVGFNLNNSSGKVRTSLNMQYSFRNTFHEIETNRFFSSDSVLSLNSSTLSPNKGYQMGYSINIDANQKWELGYDGRLNYNDNESTSDNLSQIRQRSTNETVVENQTDLTNTSGGLNLTQGFNAKYKIDSLGSEWTSDFSFNFLPGTSDQDDLNSFLDIKTNLNIISLQSNLLYKFPKRWTAETGFKISKLAFNSNRNFARRSGSLQPGDAFRSGRYSYNENINAGYAQLSKSFGPYILKGGTRLENTTMRGREEFPSDTTFNLNRTDFFPYIFFSRKLVSIAGAELRSFLKYRRTIARPGYQMLNPAQRYLDQYAFEAGNPGLKPQFTNNYEVSITAQDFPVFALGINDTKDIFNQVIYSDIKAPRNTTRTYDNLGRNRETYFQMVGLNPPGKKYFFVVVARYSHNSYNGLYEQQPFTFRRGSWVFHTMHQLKVSSNTQLMVNGFASFNGQQQFSELKNFGFLNFNVNQQLFKKKFTLSLGLYDALNTNNISSRLKQGSIDAVGSQTFDNRRFNINLRYNFGRLKKEQKNNNPFNIESPDKESN